MSQQTKATANLPPAQREMMLARLRRSKEIEDQRLAMEQRKADAEHAAEQRYWKNQRESQDRKDAEARADGRRWAVESGFYDVMVKAYNAVFLNDDAALIDVIQQTGKSRPWLVGVAEVYRELKAELEGEAPTAQADGGEPEPEPEAAEAAATE